LRALRYAPRALPQNSASAIDASFRDLHERGGRGYTDLLRLRIKVQIYALIRLPVAPMLQSGDPARNNGALLGSRMPPPLNISYQRSNASTGGIHLC